jgi:hypothetical protein
MRGRNNNNNNNSSNNSGNRKSPNPLTRSYESNGPDVKIRGSAQQIAEKYATLARDAHSAGDRVMAENYLQHAEHYNRIIMAAQGQMPAPAPRDQRDEFDDEDGDDSGDQSYNQPQEARQPEARQNDGRQNEYRDGRQQDGRQNEGRQNDGRQGEGRQQDGRQRDNRREDGRREDGRREDGRRDGENQPREHRRDQQPQPVVAREAPGVGEPRPHDGSGPQPVIEGLPVEVALEQEAMAGQKAAGRRRGRPPRAKAPDETVAAVPPAPVIAEPVAAESTAEAGDDVAARRPRRPRRSRNRDEGEQVAEDNADETPVAAQ